jgi:hypothetical protein
LVSAIIAGSVYAGKYQIMGTVNAIRIGTSGHPVESFRDIMTFHMDTTTPICSWYWLDVYDQSTRDMVVKAAHDRTVLMVSYESDKISPWGDPAVCEVEVIDWEIEWITSN